MNNQNRLVKLLSTQRNQFNQTNAIPNKNTQYLRSKSFTQVCMFTPSDKIGIQNSLKRRMTVQIRTRNKYQQMIQCRNQNLIQKFQLELQRKQILKKRQQQIKKRVQMVKSKQKRLSSRSRVWDSTNNPMGVERRQQKIFNQIIKFDYDIEQLKRKKKIVNQIYGHLKSPRMTQQKWNYHQNRYVSGYKCGDILRKTNALMKAQQFQQFNPFKQ